MLEQPSLISPCFDDASLWLDRGVLAAVCLAFRWIRSSERSRMTLASEEPQVIPAGTPRTLPSPPGHGHGHGHGHGRGRDRDRDRDPDPDPARDD